MGFLKLSKGLAAVLVGLIVISANAGYQKQREFPLGPDARLTPGSYCKSPDNYRYPERIAYCNRNVDSSEKYEVIENYNRELGYNITRKNRPQFKIDHLIPLCAGGSNNKDNLWPQHQSVYNITDPVEGLACQRMAEGKLTQKRAVELIFEAKNNLDRAADVIDQLQSM